MGPPGAARDWGTTEERDGSVVLSDPTPEVWGRPRGTSAGLYRGLPYKPGHAYETNPRHRRGNRGSERRVREAEEDTREAEEDKE